MSAGSYLDGQPAMAPIGRTNRRLDPCVPDAVGSPHPQPLPMLVVCPPMPDTRPPTVSELTNIILAGLRAQRGPTSTAEIRQIIDRAPAITAEQRALVHGAGPGTEVQYRTRWALVDLRRKGLVERVGPRSWRLAPTGAQGSNQPAH